MKLSDFDYQLPKNMIAQAPAAKRDQAKLLVLDLDKDHIKHQRFDHIIDIISPEDTIVLNDTRVVNARLKGYKPTGGKIELLVLEPHTIKPSDIYGPTVVECLVKGKVKSEQQIEIDFKSKVRPDLKAKILSRIKGGRFKVEFRSKEPLTDILSKLGHVPLPPYIKMDLKDPERYQTVYSNIDGSVAAPTAGLHFTSDLLKTLQDKGITLAYVTLHISYGTFTPVRAEDITCHIMDKEYAIITEENAKLINKARTSENGRLIAVGTTTMRTLEAAALNNIAKDDTANRIDTWEGWTDLFIYPGFKFKARIDSLITNFHLPKSTLLMLVSAFAGKNSILKAYQEAIDKKYRFYSLGDAMMIIK